MRRHHHADAIVEHCRLVAGRSRLALHHRVGLDDRRFDRVGQLHADRALVVELHDHVHAVLEEGRGVAEQVARKADLLVIVLVHEGQHVAVVEQELEVLGVEADALDRLGGAEADVGLAAVDEVLHLDLHVGAALAGLGVLDLHRAPDAALIFDDVAGTDVHAADLHDRLPARLSEKSRRGARPADWRAPLAAGLLPGKQRIGIDRRPLPPFLARLPCG